MRSFCAAACWVLLALQSEASDPNKPLIEYTHTVWTHKDGIPSAFLYSIAQTLAVVLGQQAHALAGSEHAAPDERKNHGRREALLRGGG
jgi:hypothetical protein